jgi:uncharacterized protein (TIGR02217 family)
MASFMEAPRFPDDISYGVEFGPEFVTEVVGNDAGRESRNRVRQRALCTGDCAHAVKSQAEMKVLLTFFRSVGGRFSGFRFKDWSDYQLALADSSLTLVPATTNQFQINKLYQAAVGFSELRPIRKPVAGTLVLKDAGVTVAAGSGAGQWVLDSTTGIITIGAGLTRTAANLTASCDFDVPVRFETDKMSSKIESWGSRSWEQIPIKELRNP